MIKQYKVDEVNNLVEKLKEKNNIILTDYSGVSVAGLSVLRRKLREKNADYKVVKNNLLKLALEKSGYEGFQDYIKGPIGVTFLKDEIGEIAKILKDFAKDQENFSYSIGILDNTLYVEDQIKRIADLPSKEVLLSQTMSMINAPATYIAMGMNQIMASLARGINAVAEAQNN
ncbi:MAG TPA: 50S ribosomal protein L10 [Spirochaetota bacterium]|nr:50S ribosomal protein L10 [Spirochaetota bacterium]HPI90267.1 50S ribosomal protein L10 [Spirochaetota bacterium]HPR46492.1 50S ribosomal protein L10 [Spirochaetota bacterium]